MDKDGDGRASKGDAPAGDVGGPQVFTVLRTRIALGQYTPGSWLPSERALAQEFGVDRYVIRDAFGRLEQQGLIVREPGRRPWVSHQPAPATTGKRPEGRLSRTVAAVLPQHVGDYASREMLRGMSQVLRSQETPYRLLIFDTDLRGTSRSALERDAAEAIASEGIGGAVVWPTLDEGSLTRWQRVQAQGHPVVFVDRYDESLACDFVGTDNYAAAKEAVRYLLRLGHRRIAHLTSDEPISTVLERAAGYHDALHESATLGATEMIWAVPHAPHDRIEMFVAHLTQAADPPTAVFAMNDSLAHALIAQIEAHGRRVPDDVSVLGFDDVDRYSPRPALLTTMQQPFERIGQRAAEILLRRLSSGQTPPLAYQQVLLCAPLIERVTCRRLNAPGK